MSFLSSLKNAKDRVNSSFINAQRNSSPFQKLVSGINSLGTKAEGINRGAAGFAQGILQGSARATATIGGTVASPTRATELQPKGRFQQEILGNEAVPNIQSLVKNLPKSYQGNVNAVQNPSDFTGGLITRGLNPTAAKFAAVPLTFAGLVGKVDPTLGGGEKKVGKKALEDLPSIVKKIHPEDLRVMADFVDHAGGLLKKATKSFDPNVFEGEVRRMAEHYGINPNQTNKKLAGDFKNIINQGADNGKVLDRPLKATIPQSKSSPVPLRENNRYAGSKPGMAAPETLYHGTASSFDKFDINKAGEVKSADWGKGIYLTPDKEEAGKYAIEASKANKGKANVKEVYISPEAKIKDIYFGSGTQTNQNLGKELLDEGYDGARIHVGPKGDVDTFHSETIIANPDVLKTKGVRNAKSNGIGGNATDGTRLSKAEMPGSGESMVGERKGKAGVPPSKEYKIPSNVIPDHAGTPKRTEGKIEVSGKEVADYWRREIGVRSGDDDMVKLAENDGPYELKDVKIKDILGKDKALAKEIADDKSMTNVLKSDASTAPAIISNKYGVLDGYHRIAAAYKENPNGTIRAYITKTNTPRTGESGFFDIAEFMPKKLRDKLGLSKPELPAGERPDGSSTGLTKQLNQVLAKQETPKLGSSSTKEATGLPGQTNPSKLVPQLNKALMTDISLNTRKFNVTPEAKKTIEANVEQMRPELEKIVGTKLSNDEVVQAAVGADMLTKVVDRADTKAFEAQLLKLRQTVAAGAEGKGISKEFLENLKTLKSLSADTGRRLQSFNIGADASYKTAKEEITKRILEVNDNVDEILKAAEGVDFTKPKEVTAFYRQFVKATAAEIIDEYRYINLLSSPKTHIVNATSNIIQALGLNPATKLASGLIDTVASRLTGKQQQHYVSEVPQYVRGLVASVPKATADAFDVLTGKRFTNRPDINTLGTNKPILRSLQIVPRALEASDIFFQSLIKEGERASIAQKYLKMGKTITPEALDAAAAKKAQYWVFRKELDSANESGQGALLSQIDKMTEAVYTMRKVPGVKWFIPFVQTPANILKQMIEFSPVGLANVVGSKDKVEQLGKAMIGSMVFAGAGSVVMNNDVTWAVPTDKTAKDDFYAAGRKPYSVKIGDKWVDYTKFGPLSFPIALAAAMKYESVNPDNQGKQTEEKMGAVVGDMAKFFTDQSYLKGMSDFIRMTQGDKQSFDRTLTNIPRQLVPLSSLQGWVSRIIDPVYRKADSTVDSIKATIPFLSKQVEAFTDKQGNESKRSFPLFNALSPVPVNKADPDAEQEYEQIQGLKQATKQEKARTGNVKAKATTLFNELHEMPEDQRKAALKDMEQSGDLDEDTYKAYIKLIDTKAKEAKTGKLSNFERSLKSADTDARAQVIYDEIGDKPENQRLAILRSYEEKGILTEETYKKYLKILDSNQ